VNALINQAIRDGTTVADSSSATPETNRSNHDNVSRAA
jgi:hypothetical protein